MPEEKTKISIEKLITEGEKAEVEKKSEQVEKTGVSPENISNPNKSAMVEQKELKQEDSLENSELKNGEGELGGIVRIGNARQHKSQQVKEIEDIMASDLKDVFLKMSPDKRAKFKLVGEETAVKINELLDKTKVKVRKIIRLLRKWLTMIPGANKYFLEQKVKIKADEIIALKNNDNNT